MKLMKTIFVILAVCCTIWSTSIISLGAELTLSKEEALDLIVNASDFCNTVVDGYAYGTWGPLLDYDSENIIMNIDGREYRYYAVFEERLPGGSYNGMKEYAKDIFCAGLFCTQETQRASSAQYSTAPSSPGSAANAEKERHTAASSENQST